MASLSSHSNNDIPLAILIDWYKVRDTMFGASALAQNIPLALELAATCGHPDARWLTETCAGKNVKTIDDAKRVFSALGQNDARALCFMWLCCEWIEQEDVSPLRRSADLGFAFALVKLADRVFDEDRFNLAELAAAQGERDGLYLLGSCLRDGIGCEKDLDKAKENFLLASKLGHVWSTGQLGSFLDETIPQRWQWWGQAAALGDFWNFLGNFAKQVELFNSGSGSAAVMFAIGRALQGHVNEEARTIFNTNYNFDSWIGPVKQVIAFYEAQIQAAQSAMRAWTLVGIKLNVVKDVRKLIAKLIWDSREEALFKDLSLGV